MSALKHRVWEIVSTDGNLESEFSTESIDAQKEALKYCFSLWMRFNDLKVHLNHNFNAILKAAKDSEDEAVFIESLINVHPEKEILLAYYKGEDYEPLLWKKLEPEINS